MTKVEQMDEIGQADRVELTEAETTALRVVAGRGGRASWHGVAQVLSPIEHLGQDINPVRILGRLESAGLVASAPGDAGLVTYAVTAKSTERLRAGTG